MSDAFEADPDVPAAPTDLELNEFWIACAEVMRDQPITPQIMMLKASISITFAQRAEIERLRVALGQPVTSVEESVALLQDFLDKARG